MAVNRFFFGFFVSEYDLGGIFGLLHKNIKNVDHYSRIIASPSVLFSVFMALVFSLFLKIQIHDFINDSLSFRSFCIGIGLSFFMVFFWVGSSFLGGICLDEVYKSIILKIF